jgi:undecaprenyl diphosphate synthase
LRRDFEKQSTPKNDEQIGRPENVAIIMDGNRRWARARGLPDVAGHRAGAQALEALLPAVGRTGIRTVTLFGFSQANWQRSRFEVEHLLELVERHLDRCTPACLRERIAVEVIGRKDRLPDSLLLAIDRIERATANGTRRLRIAFDYSSRDAILEAAQTLPSDTEALGDRLGGTALVSDVDLLIRTGKEQRLSDFMLWECAFAELYFPDLYWPEFDAAALETAFAWYGQRQRRMGR